MIEQNTDNYHKIVEERLKEQSLAGATGKREGKTITMLRKTYHSRLRKVAILVAVATGIAINGGNAVINKMQETKIVTDLATDFKKDCLDNARDPKIDQEGHYCDVAAYIENMYDFDIGMYLLESNTNEDEVNQVLQRTYFGSLDNYLNSINYENMKSWKEDIRERIVTDDKIYNSKVELQDMIEGHRNEIYGEENRAGLLH